MGGLAGRRLQERWLPHRRKEIARMYAVIMAGGEGARFWPVSRSNCPKPFLSILGGDPLVVQTLKRLEGLVPPERILVLINRKQEEVARRLLAGLPPENLILEPRIRDTAPCVGLAAKIVRHRAGGAANTGWRSCRRMRAYNQDDPGGPDKVRINTITTQLKITMRATVHQAI